MPLQSIVIGKPMLPSDVCNSGWISSSNLAAWIAKSIGAGLGPAGVMAWQFHSDPDSATWSETVASGFGGPG